MDEGKGMTPEAAFNLIAENELFTDLCAILRSGERTQKSDEPVAEGETVVGELTPFEIALYCARGEMIDRAVKMAEELEECQGPNCPLCRYALKLQAVDKLFAASIELSLNILDKSFAIRDGYKVVERDKKNSGISIGIMRFG